MAERMKVQQRQKKDEVKLHQVAEARHYTRASPEKKKKYIYIYIYSIRQHHYPTRA